MADLTRINVLALPARGPWSNGVRIGEMVFTSGQVPVDPATGLVHGPGMQEQVHQSMRNIEAILAAAGTDTRSIVKVVAYLLAEEDFADLSEAYAQHFPVGEYPARTTITVASLPIIGGVLCRVIIDAIPVVR